MPSAPGDAGRRAQGAAGTGPSAGRPALRCRRASSRDADPGRPPAHARGRPPELATPPRPRPPPCLPLPLPHVGRAAAAAAATISGPLPLPLSLTDSRPRRPSPRRSAHARPAHAAAGPRARARCARRAGAAAGRGRGGRAAAPPSVLSRLPPGGAVLGGPPQALQGCGTCGAEGTAEATGFCETRFPPGSGPQTRSRKTSGSC